MSINKADYVGCLRKHMEHLFYASCAPGDPRTLAANERAHQVACHYYVEAKYPEFARDPINTIIAYVPRRSRGQK